MTYPLRLTDKTVQKYLAGKIPDTDCPVCGTHYAIFWKVGDLCGDLSQGQPDPCPGRVVLAKSASGAGTVGSRGVT